MTVAALDRARAALQQPPAEVPAGQLAVPDGPAIGSVCTGYGGLDMAVQQVLGGHLAWVADPDPGAAAVLAHHHPGTPNLGDITTLDWATVPPVDVLCGGYPCQPFSVAGRRKGTKDERHIWPYIAGALGVLRPQLAVFENVANHLRIGFDQVLRDLAGLGFDAEWVVVRASEVGAPHQRKRLFLLAWPTNSQGPRLPGTWLRGRPAERGRGPAADPADLGHERLGGARGRWAGPADCGHPASDTDRNGREGQQRRGPGMGARDDADRRGPEGRAAADSEGVGRGEGRPEPAGQQRGPGAPSGSAPDWGRYAPAVACWETVTGRCAPWATDARGRLNPPFVEWLMGLPAGHVTAVPGLTRTQQLHALGNGVVPQQGAAALRLLLGRALATR